MIEARFGREIRSSSDCEAFAASVFEVTHQHLGNTSAKRLFGFTGEKNVTHRSSTMDVLAKYLGYNDMRCLTDHLGEGYDISKFEEIEEIDFGNLEKGTQVRITYDPNRVLSLTYLGDNIFFVDDSQRSKLRQGDQLHITQIAKGFELLISDVVRDGRSLGSYHAAKDGGLTSVEIV